MNKENRLAPNVGLLRTVSWLSLVGQLVSGYARLASGDGVLTIEPSVVTFKGDRRAQAVTFTCALPAGVDTSSITCISLKRKGSDDNDFRVISQVCVDKGQQEQSTAGLNSSLSSSSVNVVKIFSNEYSAASDVHGTLKVTKQDPLCTESHFVYRCVIRQVIHVPEGIIPLTYAQDGVVGVVSVPSPHIFTDTETGTDVDVNLPMVILHCRSLQDFASVAQTAKTVKTGGPNKAVSVSWQALEDDVWVDLPETSSTTSVFRDSCWVFTLVSLFLPRIVSSRRFRCLAVSDGHILGVAYHDVIVPEKTLIASSSSTSRKKQLMIEKTQNGIFEDTNFTIRLMSIPVGVLFLVVIFLIGYLSRNCRNQPAPDVQLDAFLVDEDLSATVMEQSFPEVPEERFKLILDMIEVSAEASADNDVARLDTLDLSSGTVLPPSSRNRACAWKFQSTPSLFSLASFDPETIPAGPGDSDIPRANSHPAAYPHASFGTGIPGSTPSQAPPKGEALPRSQRIKSGMDYYFGYVK